MTQLGVFHLTFTVFIAFVAVQTVGTFSFRAINSFPAGHAVASSISFVTSRTVSARTTVGAIDAEFIEGTLIETFVANKTWLTNTMT
jgi:hypothetical protein